MELPPSSRYIYQNNPLSPFRLAFQDKIYHAKTCLLTLLLNIHRWFNVASMIIWKLSTHTHCGYNPYKFYIMLKEKPLSASSDDPLQLKRLTTLKEMNLLNIWKYMVRVDPIWYPPPYPATMRICYVHLCSNCCVFMVFQEEKARRENEESQSRFSGLFCMLYGPGDIQSACLSASLATSGWMQDMSRLLWKIVIFYAPVTVGSLLAVGRVK